MSKVVFIKGDGDRANLILKHLYDLYISNHFTSKTLNTLNDYTCMLPSYLSDPKLYCTINKNNQFLYKSETDLSYFVNLGFADFFTIDEFLDLCPLFIGDKVELKNLPGIKFTISEKYYLGKDKGFIFKFKEEDSIDWRLCDIKFKKSN